MRQFSLIDFPLDLGGKKFVGSGRKFSPGFPLLLYSSHSQTEENSVFHPIFLLIFSILPKFHPTKHSVKDKGGGWNFRISQILWWEHLKWSTALVSNVWRQKWTFRTGPAPFLWPKSLLLLHRREKVTRVSSLFIYIFQFDNMNNNNLNIRHLPL